MDTIEGNTVSLKSLGPEPFEYHRKLSAHFKTRKKTWDWFADESNREEQVKEFRSEMLKNTYRLDKEAYGSLYAISDQVCKSLAIDAEVTLYQQNNSIQLNAGISIIGKEAHVVLSGNLLNILSEKEIKALIAHELSHYLFYKIENEEFEITQRIILALANDQRTEDAIIETARVFQLYMELFCDLGSLRACEDYQTTIQTLVKINTGLSDVNADSYLKQAEEILKVDPDSTKQDTHPEPYIRSLALKLAADGCEDYDKKLKEMIEGPLDINCLDIFDQVTMQGISRDLIQCIVTPKWIISSAVMNLCNEYFDDFHKTDKHRSLEELGRVVNASKDSVKNYVSYVLLDFAKVDPDMETTPLGFTLEIAELLGISDTYNKLLRKELKLTVRDFKLLKEKAMGDLQQVKESKDESLYNE